LVVPVFCRALDSNPSCNHVLCEADPFLTCQLEATLGHCSGVVSVSQRRSGLRWTGARWVQVPLAKGGKRGWVGWS